MSSSHGKSPSEKRRTNQPTSLVRQRLFQATSFDGWTTQKDGPTPDNAIARGGEEEVTRDFCCGSQGERFGRNAYANGGMACVSQELHTCVNQIEEIFILAVSSVPLNCTLPVAYYLCRSARADCNHFINRPLTGQRAQDVSALKRPMRIETYLDAANTYLFRLASLWFRTARPLRFRPLTSNLRFLISDL